MPILTRQPEATDAPAMHLANVPRPGDASVGSTSPSPADLLPSGGTLAPAPVPAPARALALDALRLLRRLRDPAQRPARWSQPSFAREIELVRSHLAPLRSRKALAASYGREAFHYALDETARDDPSAVRLAYALRWLELADGVTGPGWSGMWEAPLADRSPSHAADVAIPQASVGGALLGLLARLRR
jgi:hypothetical protein